MSGCSVLQTLPTHSACWYLAFGPQNSGGCSSEQIFPCLAGDWDRFFFRLVFRRDARGTQCDSGAVVLPYNVSQAAENVEAAASHSSFATQTESLLAASWSTEIPTEMETCDDIKSSLWVWEAAGPSLECFGKAFSMTMLAKPLWYVPVSLTLGPFENYLQSI